MRTGRSLAPFRRGPRWPFDINTKSPQADGLGFWLPFSRYAGTPIAVSSVIHDMINATPYTFNATFGPVWETPSEFAHAITNENNIRGTGCVDTFVYSVPSTQTMSIVVYFRTPTTLAAYGPLLETRDGIGLGGLLMSGDTGNPLTASWTGGSGEYSATTGLALTAGVDYVGVMTINGAALKVYLVGPLGLKSFDIVVGATSRAISNWYTFYDAAAGAPYYGWLYDLRIYPSRVLEPDQIWQLSDARTCFELYAPSVRRRFAFTGAPAAAGVTVAQEAPIWALQQSGQMVGQVYQ